MHTVDVARTSTVVQSAIMRSLGLSSLRLERAVASLRRSETYHESVVERREDMRDAEDELAFARLGADVRSHDASNRDGSMPRVHSRRAVFTVFCLGDQRLVYG